MFGYLFFTTDNKEPPILLTTTLFNAKKHIDNIVVVTTADIKNKLFLLFPDLIILLDSSIPQSKAEKDYILNINQGTIKSNHPPTELLCLRRWTVLSYLYDNQYVSRDDICINLDWDNILFDSIKELNNFIETKHLVGAPLLSCFEQMGIKGSSIENKLPIYEICPSLMYINNSTIKIYNSYLMKILENKSFLSRKFANRFFNDMCIWSITLSHINLKEKKSIVLDLDEIGRNLCIFADHNVRVNYQGFYLDFVMEDFHIPPQFNYSSNQELSIKKITFNGVPSCPFIELNDNKNMNLACAHFQGIESKYILLNEVKFRHLLFS